MTFVRRELGGFERQRRTIARRLPAEALFKTAETEMENSFLEAEEQL